MDYICACMNAKRHHEYRKILTTDQHVFPEFTLTEVSAIPYQCGTLLEEKEYFFIEHTKEQKYAIELIKKEYLTQDFNTLKDSEIAELDFLFAFSKDTSQIYFQNITKSMRIGKKGFLFVDGRFTFQDEWKLISVHPEPDAIYDRETDKLYFRRLESLTGIFKGIDQLYREATEQETEAFLCSDFIRLSEGFSADKVKTANRKRIALALETLSSLKQDQRRNLVQYIGQYCPNLKVDDNQFGIGSEQDLKYLLYGIDQRFYTTAISQERRLANSVVSID